LLFFPFHACANTILAAATCTALLALDTINSTSDANVGAATGTATAVLSFVLIFVFVFAAVAGFAVRTTVVFTTTHPPPSHLCRPYITVIPANLSAMRRS
jgi:hypothetical protein